LGPERAGAALRLRGPAPHADACRLASGDADDRPFAARAFDSPRRSVALDPLLAFVRMELLTPDELARFSADTRAWLERVSAL
jgi:hypothetical protein